MFPGHHKYKFPSNPFVPSFSSNLGRSVPSALLPELPLETEQELHALPSLERSFQGNNTLLQGECDGH